MVVCLGRRKGDDPLDEFAPIARPCSRLETVKPVLRLGKQVFLYIRLASDGRRTRTMFDPPFWILSACSYALEDGASIDDE